MDSRQLLMAAMQSGNPQQFVMNLLQERMGGNPMLQNLFQLAQRGDSASIESIVKNIAKERGIDFDKEFTTFRKLIK